MQVHIYSLEIAEKALKGFGHKGPILGQSQKVGADKEHRLHNTRELWFVKNDIDYDSRTPPTTNKVSINNGKTMVYWYARISENLYACIGRYQSTYTNRNK